MGEGKGRKEGVERGKGGRGEGWVDSVGERRVSPLSLRKRTHCSSPINSFPPPLSGHPTSKERRENWRGMEGGHSELLAQLELEGVALDCVESNASFLCYELKKMGQSEEEEGERRESEKETFMCSVAWTENTYPRIPTYSELSDVKSFRLMGRMFASAISVHEEGHDCTTNSTISLALFLSSLLFVFYRRLLRLLGEGDEWSGETNRNSLLFSFRFSSFPSPCPEGLPSMLCVPLHLFIFLLFPQIRTNRIGKTKTGEWIHSSISGVPSSSLVFHLHLLFIVFFFFPILLDHWSLSDIIFSLTDLFILFSIHLYIILSLLFTSMPFYFMCRHGRSLLTWSTLLPTSNLSSLGHKFFFFSLYFSLYKTIPPTLAPPLPPPLPTSHLHLPFVPLSFPSPALPLLSLSFVAPGRAQLMGEQTLLFKLRAEWAQLDVSVRREVPRSLLATLQHFRLQHTRIVLLWLFVL